MAMLQTKIKIYVHKSGGPIVVTREKTWISMALQHWRQAVSKGPKLLYKRN